MSLLDVVRHLVDNATLSNDDKAALHAQLDAEAGAGSSGDVSADASATVEAAPTAAEVGTQESVSVPPEQVSTPPPA